MRRSFRAAGLATAVLCLGVAPVWAHVAPGGAHRHHKHPKPSHARYEAYHGTVGGEGWPVYTDWFAVPACIVNAESHGLVHEHSHPWGSSGLYQIEPGTWDANGGSRFAALPYEASKREQSLVAARIWDHGRGAGNWSTAYGCGY